MRCTSSGSFADAVSKRLSVGFSRRGTIRDSEGIVEAGIAMAVIAERRVVRPPIRDTGDDCMPADACGRDRRDVRFEGAAEGSMGYFVGRGIAGILPVA